MLKRIVFIAILALGLNAEVVSQDECEQRGEGYIFAGKECINYAIFEGDDNEKLLILVHGTWDEGANVLGRYEPFAETLNFATDVTTIAVALPGYSKSSLNSLKSIGSKTYKHQAATKAYVNFLGELLMALKQRYESQSISVVGHSAGAMMTAALSGLQPKLINNAVLVGGRYSIENRDLRKTLVAEDVLDKMSQDTQYILVYGTADEISKPEETINFYDQAQNAGLNVDLVEVEGASHIDLDMTDDAVEAITSLFE